MNFFKNRITPYKTMGIFYALIFIFGSPYVMADLIKIGEREQYYVYIKSETLYRKGESIEFVANFSFKEGFEYSKDEFYDNINVKYNVNCASLDYQQSVISIFNSKTGRYVDKSDAEAYKFAVPKSKLDQYLQSACHAK